MCFAMQGCTIYKQDESMFIGKWTKGCDSEISGESASLHLTIQFYVISRPTGSIYSRLGTLVPLLYLLTHCLPEQAVAWFPLGWN